MRILDKLSWLSSLIAMNHTAFKKEILDNDILKLVLKMTDRIFPTPVRLNAVLAIS